ncbi:TRAP transporter small permease subunit [Neoroseomonas lacus]|uniref:TRAP transporter small permease protein n=1 Tax=Neoroseomonas lacus TaxID=287609 RepID=A0A917KZZ7_9PROT|nr:TRAP transporter small permease [Neoroseomonas lacus]GGJ34922.1 C4-dicarboxylate ABC transporter permease [Neoroseomonas lacus]
MQGLIVLATAISRAGAWFGGGLVVLAAVIVSVDVLLRAGFSFTIGGSDELSGYALAVSSAFAFALALLDRAHVRIDTLYTLLPVRVAAAFDLLAMAAMVSLASFLAMQSWRVFAQSWSLGARALTQLNTPLSYPQGLWFAGLAWFALVSILLMLRALILMVRGDAMGVQHLLGTKTAAEELADERAAQQAIRAGGGAA